MSKEKQIEEMANIIDKHTTFDTMWEESMESAEALYNAGYRKQSEWISVDESVPEEDGLYVVKAGLNSNNASEETKAELAKLIDFANKFHRVSECGVIEKGE